MPVIRPGDAPIEQPDAPHPVLGSYTAHLLSDAGGLTQFGAFTETLPPGSRSSLRHWHVTEDEFIYMLSGIIWRTRAMLTPLIWLSARVRPVMWSHTLIMTGCSIMTVQRTNGDMKP